MGSAGEAEPFGVEREVVLNVPVPDMCLLASMMATTLERDGMPNAALYMRKMVELAAGQHAALRAVDAAPGGGDLANKRHVWTTMDRPRECLICGYVEHDGSGIGYQPCPATPTAAPAPNVQALVEAAARAICRTKNVNPDCLYQHNFEGDYPEDERREYRDPFTGEPRVQLFHRAWRHSVKEAEAALSAIQAPAGEEVA